MLHGLSPRCKSLNMKETYENDFVPSISNLDQGQLYEISGQETSSQPFTQQTHGIEISVTLICHKIRF